MGRIIVYTGDGQGKTSSSLGLALRSIAHGKKVVMVQFMKGRKDTGEYLIKDILPNFEIHQFGGDEFVDLLNPGEEDRRLAQEGLKFAKEILKEKPYLLILDEINLACHINLISVDDVVDLIRSKPEETNIILTGRYADDRLIDIADTVTEMKKIKREKVGAIEGIEF